MDASPVRGHQGRRRAGEVVTATAPQMGRTNQQAEPGKAAMASGELRSAVAALIEAAAADGRRLSPSRARHMLTRKAALIGDLAGLHNMVESRRGSRIADHEIEKALS